MSYSRIATLFLTMILQLPLHKIHRESGAHFGFHKTWELPEHYGNPSLEYQGVRKNVGLADLSYQGKFLVTGDDRQSFLQGLVSNDLSQLSKVSGIYTTLLTAKGKMVADFFLFSLSDALLMEIEWENAEKTKSRLMRYRLRSRVAFVVPPWGKLLVSGPASKKVLEQLLREPLPEMREKSFFERELDGCRLLCIKRSVTGETDFHLYYPTDKIDVLWGKLTSEGSAFNIQPVGQAALEVLRVEAGKARYGTDFDEEIIPIEAGIQDEAISYTKGCYPGQETIARIKTYGHVNKKLSGLILEGDLLPQKGDKIFHGEKAAGWVSSAVRSPWLGKGIAMGYLLQREITPGTVVGVDVKGIRVRGVVVDLPFYHNNDAVQQQKELS